MGGITRFCIFIIEHIGVLVAQLRHRGGLVGRKIAKLQEINTIYKQIIINLSFQSFKKCIGLDCKYAGNVG